MTIDYHLHSHNLLSLTTSIDITMSYSLVFVIACSIALWKAFQTLLAARSDLTESLMVQVITPKRSSSVASAMEEPLRTPALDVSLLVVGAQQLSISDPTAEVDDLISALSSLSMEAPPLKSCRKSYHFFPTPNAFPALCTVSSRAQSC